MLDRFSTKRTEIGKTALAQYLLIQRLKYITLDETPNFWTDKR